MSRIPRFDTLTTLLARSTDRFATRRLFGARTEQGWPWCSHAELARHARELSAGLSAIGVGAGDRVVVITKSRFEWAALAEACIRLGAIVVPLHEKQSPDEWLHALNDSGAEVCFVASAACYEQLERRLHQAPGLECLVCLEHAAYRRLRALGAAKQGRR